MLQNILTSLKTIFENESANTNAVGLKYFERILNLYATNLLMVHIESIVNRAPTITELNNLASKLGEFFEVIRHTDYVAIHTPYSELNQILVALAQYLAMALNRDPYTILFPSLEISEYVLTFTTLIDPSLKIADFLLTDDDKAIIEVTNCLEGAVNDGVLKYSFLVNGNIRKLTDSERDRVIKHSQEAGKYYNAIQYRLKAKEIDESYGSVLSRLVSCLRDGGKHSHEDGSEYIAGQAANVGIKNFYEWFYALTRKERTYLRKFKSPHRSCLGEFIERLFIPSKELLAENQEPRFCVELIADGIDGILQYNPILYTKYPQKNHKKTSNAQQKNIIYAEENLKSTKLNLDKVMAASGPRKINSSYGLQAKIIFVKQLFAKLNNSGLCIFEHSEFVRNILKLLQSLSFDELLIATSTLETILFYDEEHRLEIFYELREFTTHSKATLTLELFPYIVSAINDIDTLNKITEVFCDHAAVAEFLSRIINANPTFLNNYEIMLFAIPYARYDAALLKTTTSLICNDNFLEQLYWIDPQQTAMLAPILLKNAAALKRNDDRSYDLFITKLAKNLRLLFNVKDIKRCFDGIYAQNLPNLRYKIQQQLEACFTTVNEFRRFLLDIPSDNWPMVFKLLQPQLSNFDKFPETLRSIIKGMPYNKWDILIESCGSLVPNKDYFRARIADAKEQEIYSDFSDKQEFLKAWVPSTPLRQYYANLEAQLKDPAMKMIINILEILCTITTTKLKSAPPKVSLLHLKEVLVYLTTGLHPSEKTLPHLDARQYLTIKQAIAEVYNLCEYQLQALELLYKHGLRGWHLRSFRTMSDGLFTEKHLQALCHLMLDTAQCQPAQDALAMINRTTPAQAEEIYLPKHNKRLRISQG